MPLKMSSELRFPMGASVPLKESAVNDLLALARRISSPSGRKFILETFKKYFCTVNGEYYAQSSSLSWAESDLDRAAEKASCDAPGFIAAFCDACESLQNNDISVPDQRHINKVLENHNIPFRIVENELQETTDYIPAPDQTPSESVSVARALSDAKALLGQGNPSSAIDRAHTALHGYLINLCQNSSINVDGGTTTAKAFKLLREKHPALIPSGERADDVTRMLQSFATSVDTFSPIRNKASLAHANPLLDEPEALAVMNAIYTIFRYIQDSIHRYER